MKESRFYLLKGEKSLKVINGKLVYPTEDLRKDLLSVLSGEFEIVALDLNFWRINWKDIIFHFSFSPELRILSFPSEKESLAKEMVEAFSKILGESPRIRYILKGRRFYEWSPKGDFSKDEFPPEAEQFELLC